MDKIINLLINNWTKGVDTYTHNGSTWLIFTEQKSWVIELTESKTLWYNYNFFRELFSITSMDVVENQDYITKWVEDNIINGVKEIKYNQSHQEPKFKEVLKNGVKETHDDAYHHKGRVDGVINNGVKETNHVDVMGFFNTKMEDTLENGVKNIRGIENDRSFFIENTLKMGVRETKPIGKESPNYSKVVINYITQNGTKNPSV